MPPAREPDRPLHRSWWLRRADQAGVAILALAALVSLAGYWISRGAFRGRLIEIDDVPPLSARYEVDINAAGWPEFSQLPGVGETLARRIVESREAGGPFADLDDLRRVRGIGPKTLENMKPYLRPMPSGASTAGR